MKAYFETNFKETEIGKIPKDWEIKEIGEICEKISSGGTPSRNKKKYWNDGTIFWLKTKELLDKKIFSTEEKINKIGLKNSSAKLFPKNTIVLAMYGLTVGKLGILGKEMTTNQACCCMILNKKNYFYFLFLFLFLNRQKLKNMSTGAAQQNLNQEMVSKLKIPLPPTLQEQKNISKILSDLDEKIENNKKINEILEEIGKSIFKRWFVDFEFEDENGKPYQSNGGAMIHNLELEKEIPEGWEVGKIGELVDYIIDNRGKSPKTKKCDSIPLVEVNAIIGNGRIINVKECKKFLDEKIYSSFFRTGHPKYGDILLSTVGSIGEIAKVFNEKICIAQNLIGLRHKNFGNYFYQLLKSIQKEIITLNISSVQPSVKVPHLLKIIILKPPKYLKEKFEFFLNPISKQIYNNELENQKLQALRDYLLPKIMKGEIRIKY